MKKFMMAALAALVTVAAAASLAASVADTREDAPSSEEITKYAFSYMRQLSSQGMSDREIANQLASSMIWSEKVQLVCSSYYYVNASRARYDYLLRQGTWNMMFGPGKTSTSIMNEASAKRNREFNNNSSKRDWCENVKAFGIKTFDWGPLFEAD
jgi:opacity protein-like surface antigen